jgi:hypothetical protein
MGCVLAICKEKMGDERPKPTNESRNDYSLPYKSDKKKHMTHYDDNLK